MQIISPKEELLKVFDGEDIGYFPRSILLFTPVVDMMKTTSSYFPAANYEGDKMAKLALAAHELGNWNAIMLPWASTVEMEALGCEVTNNKDDIASYPQFKRKVFEDYSDVSYSRDILKKGSLPAVFEATRIVKEVIDKKYDGGIPIFSMFQGPFTVASYCIGFDKMFKSMISNPKEAYKVLDIISDVNILYGNEMLKNGGDFITMSDPAAEGLGSDHFEQILLPIYKKINAAIDCKKMMHICGKTSRIINHLGDTGFNGYSFDYPKLQVEAVKKAVGSKMQVIGSVPTITHLLEGTKEEVINISLSMISSGVDILAPSCGLPSYTPLDNVKAIAEAISIWNKEKFGIEIQV